MNVSNDPFVAGARALRDSRDKGMINEEQYKSMYAALARAAELDTVRCEVEGCDQTAYIGKRCAAHFCDMAQLRARHV
jgi:hypothetical protein